MSFLNKAKKALLEKRIESENLLVVEFGEQFISKIMELKNSNHSYTGLSVNFPESLMKEICMSIETHQASNRVLYSDEMQYLNIVGESFHQEELKNVFSEHGEAWLSGVLVPEPYNPHDANAVMLAVIDPKNFEVIQAGHLAKEQAAKVQKKLISHLNKGRVIPVLLKLTGGTFEKPNIGLLARAKTSSVDFEQ